MRSARVGVGVGVSSEVLDDHAVTMGEKIQNTSMGAPCTLPRQPVGVHKDG